MCSTTIIACLSSSSRCSIMRCSSNGSGREVIGGVRRGQYARDILSPSSEVAEKWGIARVLKDG